MKVLSPTKEAFPITIFYLENYVKGLEEFIDEVESYNTRCKIKREITLVNNFIFDLKCTELCPTTTP